MRIKYDFILLYEIKNREIDSVCLLKYELERRGYSVKIKNTIIDFKSVKREIAKVVVMPFTYQNIDINYALSKVLWTRKIANLQWEQVFRKKMEEAKNSRKYKIDGFAHEVAHIAWGQRNYKRLIEDCSINERNVRITGNISFDFLRKDFRGYYIDREQLTNEFEISNDKEICLFVSTFSYVEMPKERVEISSKFQNYNLNEFVDISIKSQIEILYWIEDILRTNTKIVFIYRPHPNEVLINQVKMIANKYDNFKIIKDRSITQWILCCDFVINWYSTSIAEVLLSDKKCYIVRPYEISDEMELSIIKSKDHFITKKQDFELIFKESSGMPILIEDTYLNEYYSFANNTPSYIRVCDYLEEVYKSPYYCINFSNYFPINPFAYAILSKPWKILRSTSKKTIKYFQEKLGFGKAVKYNSTLGKWMFDLLEVNEINAEDIDIRVTNIKRILCNTAERIDCPDEMKESL